MNNKAAKLAAEHYGKTLDEVEVSRIDFFMSLWAALDGADAAGQTAAGYEVPPAERVAALSEAEIPVFSNAPVEIDAEALARGMSAVIVRAAELGGFDAEMAAALTGVNWDDAIAASNIALAGKKPMEYLAAFAEQLVDGSSRVQPKRWPVPVRRQRCSTTTRCTALHAVAMRRSRAWAKADRAMAATRPCGARSAGRAGNSIASAALAAARAIRETCTTSTSRAMRAIASARATSAAATSARLDAVAMDPSFAGGSAKRTGE